MLMRAAAGGDQNMLAGSDGRLAVRLHAPLPESIEIGRGQFLVVSGECTVAGGPVESVRVRAGEKDEVAELSPAASGVSFWQAMYLEAARTGETVPVELVVTLGGGETRVLSAGTVQCLAVDRQPVDVPAGVDYDELIAICLASYEPDLEAFGRQIDSIRAQRHDNWLCIVNDDGSSDTTWSRMQARCGDDPRFRFFRNPGNLGFYGNFEQALKRVPESAAYVALSDQDDLWYPDKLARLLEAARSGKAELAYCDMRIVDSERREVAATYWVNRRNEYRDLPVVLVANTVTGAASLFRAELLDVLLPFPPRVGDAFHDHWMACTALSIGKLAYVDAPLYEYYQHGDSVIGHCDFERFSMTQRAVSLVRFVGRLCRPSIGVPLLRGKYASALAVYRGECRRLRLLCQTPRRRCELDGRRRRQLSLFDGGAGSLFRLLVLHFKVLLRGQTTDDAELRLAMGEFARLVERRRVRSHAPR